MKSKLACGRQSTQPLAPPKSVLHKNAEMRTIVTREFADDQSGRSRWSFTLRRCCAALAPSPKPSYQEGFWHDMRCRGCKLLRCKPSWPLRFDSSAFFTKQMFETQEPASADSVGCTTRSLPCLCYDSLSVGAVVQRRGSRRVNT